MEIDSLLAGNGPLIGETRLMTTSLGRRDHVNPATGKVQAQVLIGGGVEIEGSSSEPFSTHGFAYGRHEPCGRDLPDGPG